MTHARPEHSDPDWRAGTSYSNYCAASPRDIARLASAARERLAAGDPECAYALADRLCRLIVPSARELFLRSKAHHAMGRLEAAQRDLAAAMALDPTDFAIDRAAMSWGDALTRRQAAQRVVSRATVEPALLQKAVELLIEDGAAIAHRFERTPQGVSGWIVWPDSEELEIEVRGAELGQSFVVDPDPEHWLSAPGLSAAEIAVEGDSSTTLFLDLRLTGEPVERVSPAEDPRPARTQALRPLDAPQQAEVDVTIIIPVYEDLDSTRACLEALARTKPAAAHRILVVDDGSPNPALKRYLADAADRGDFELLTNDANIGYAASVNRALALSSKGDALLLNADVILPPGAVDRLGALSRSSPDIGTVTPLSNNGELTSYPSPHEANPTPAFREIVALDVLARWINGDALVEMPNGVGFCLYITEACRGAVGGLPEIYAQGYYEDVEFCLAARERGFRNVAAPGVYVGHFGSKSFGERKRALVMRNLELIEARYPGYQIESAAFVALDPLQPFRAALDAAAPPKGPVVIVACGPQAAAALGSRRAEDLKAASPDAAVLLLRTSSLGRSVSLAAMGGGAPQSLQFHFDEASGRDAYLAYLAKLDVRRVELLDPILLPEAALTPLISGAAEIVLMCGRLGWFSPTNAPPDIACRSLEAPTPCDACRNPASLRQSEARHAETGRPRLDRALERAARVIPLDRLSEAYVRRAFPGRAAPLLTLSPQQGKKQMHRPSGSAVVKLGVLYPHPDPDGDRLLLRLARRLAAQDARASLIVFGACVDDTALMATDKAFVTGPVGVEEYSELAQWYEADALFAPDRGGGFADLDSTAAACGLRKIYFDWSFGLFAPDFGDLSLDPRICNDKAASRIVAWMKLERRPLS